MISNLKSVEENKEYLRSVIGVRGRKQIDWENSVGKEVRYKHCYHGDYSEGVLKIVRYEIKNQKVYCKGYEKGITTDSFIRCKLGGTLNLIINKAPWMMDLGVSEEDAKKYTPYSNKKIKVKCPNCGKIKKTTPNKIYERHSIACSCGDGISYPEKLMENLLIQLDIKYVRQYKTDWSQNKVYDFYLSDYNIIIETHGKQHYEESKCFPGKTLKEEEKNDKLKEELALKNGTKHYIVINCSESNLEYIKNNILDSRLSKLLDLSKIDWIKCGEYASSNLVKEVCDFYNKHLERSSYDLGKEFGMCDTTIRTYLNKGSKLGWCGYDGKEEQQRNGRRNGKPVSQFTFNSEFIKTYPSASEAERRTGIKASNICVCCNGKQKTAGGFIWKYAK